MKSAGNRNASRKPVGGDALNACTDELAWIRQAGVHLTTLHFLQRRRTEAEYGWMNHSHLCCHAGLAVGIARASTWPTVGLRATASDDSASASSEAEGGPCRCVCVATPSWAGAADLEIKVFSLPGVRLALARSARQQQSVTAGRRMQTAIQHLCPSCPSPPSGPTNFWSGRPRRAWPGQCPHSTVTLSPWRACG